MFVPLHTLPGVFQKCVAPKYGHPWLSKRPALQAATALAKESHRWISSKASRRIKKPMYLRGQAARDGQQTDATTDATGTSGTTELPAQLLCRSDFKGKRVTSCTHRPTRSPATPGGIFREFESQRQKSTNSKICHALPCSATLCLLFLLEDVDRLLGLLQLAV